MDRKMVYTDASSYEVKNQ